MARGDPEEGIRLLRAALEILYTEQHNVLLTVFIAALAEGLRKTGQLEEAFLTINGAISRAADFGATFDMAELLRLKGEVIAEMPQGDRDAAAKSLKEAIGIAREQSALAYELRSATSLVRLLAETSERDEAIGILRYTYDRFNDDLETPDLTSAHALLATFE